jgi:TonB-dependent receptor
VDEIRLKQRFLQYLQQYLNAYEDVYAAYAQYQMTLGRLGVIGGVRVEDTHSSGDAWNVLANSGTPVLDTSGNPIATPVHGSHHYTDVLPGIQLRYQLQPDLLTRFAWSSTLARPGFNQDNASETVDLGSSQVTVGNPHLRAATSTNFDLDIEKYLSDAGILQFGLFDKEISNYIVANNTGTEIIQGLPLRIYTYSNSPNAYARGVELNWQQKFTWLPGFWSGFGLGANYAYVDSRFTIRPGEHARLPSSSEHTANATLFYEKYNLTLRLAGYFVSADLFGIGTDATSDIYNAKRTFLDFGSAYSWSENWNVYFNAKDLLNTPHAFWEGSPDRPIQREFYGHTFELGVRFNY